MNLMVIFSLAGIVLGALVLDYGGWLIGGLVGFLLGQGLHLARRLKALEQELESWRARLPSPANGGELFPYTERGEPDQPFADEREQLSPATRAQDVSNSTPTPSSSFRAVVAELAGAFAEPTVEQKRKPVPSPMEKLIAHVKRFFIEGNPIVRVGMVVMFFGLGFLVRYASSEGLFPVELRLAGIALVAMALIALGWITRSRKNGYGLVLQGGGIAALYLSIFAATKVYPLLGSGLAFALMFVVVVFGAAMAVLQNAQVLALMATAGGFLAPILTSDGSGNHIGLFSFYLLLNLGVLAIAWFKTWRMLNWVGFVFTFVITSAWGVLQYEPQLYASTQPFLLGFFALYLCVSILFSLKQPPKLTGLVDGSLVFGLPVVGFGLQTALLKHTEYGLAISAVLLAAIYISVAVSLWTRYRQSCRLLVESFIALGVTFATLAIPLAMDADWTSATWALEASGLIWVGLRQRRLLPRAAGYLLYVAAGVSLFVHGDLSAGPTPIVSGDYIGMFILSASALCIAYLLKSYMKNTVWHEGRLEWLTIGLAVIWWLMAGSMEIFKHLHFDQHFVAIIFFTSLSMAGVLRFGGRLNWRRFTCANYGLLPLITLWLVFNLVDGLLSPAKLHPFQDLGLLALGSFAVVQYRFLWGEREKAGQGLVSAYHVFSAWVVLALAFWEAGWWQGHLGWFGTTGLLLWFACFALPLVLLMLLTTSRTISKGRWPFHQYHAAYKDWLPAPIMLFLLLWFIEACSHPGTINQLYLPLINPLDLAQFAAVLVLGYCIKCNFIKLRRVNQKIELGLMGLASFIWINIVALRAVHHFAGVNYAYDDLWDSVVVQMALSILWTLCALATMDLSRRKQERRVWLIGAGLLGLVVLKLFTKDLTGSGTLARILSFMVVGGLMLAIGYLAPMPVSSNASRKSAAKTTEEAAP